MTSGRAVTLTARERELAAQRQAVILADVRESLSRTPRELSPKYFYDQRGSQLFEEITRLPEYYLTRAEREILLARATEIERLATGGTHRHHERALRSMDRRELRGPFTVASGGGGDLMIAEMNRDLLAGICPSPDGQLGVGLKHGVI